MTPAHHASSARSVERGPDAASPAGSPAGPRPERRPGADRRRRLLFALLLAALAVGAFAAAHAFFIGSEDGGGGASGGGSTRAFGFEDVTRAAGIDFKMSYLPEEQGESFKINLYDHGTGIAVGDFDGDGRDDLYFCNQLGSNALYRNEGGGRFRDVTAAAGGLAMADRISVASVFADYDGDGDQDLYVTTTRGGNVLWRNRGDGTFEDVTAMAGLTLVAHSETPTFFDADGDGFLDLLVTNTAKWTTDVFDEKAHYFRGGASLLDLVGSVPESNRYYRNRGDGTFEDATEASGLAGPGWGGDVAVFDYDRDGDLDVLVGNMFGMSVLYGNDGKAHFSNVTREVLGRTSFGTIGARAFDYDGDGLLDLFLVDMHSDMWMSPNEDVPPPLWSKKFPGPVGPASGRDPVAEKDFETRARFNVADVVFGNTLFHALGGGRFEEVSDKAGVETLWPWGIADGDFDGDGWTDAFLPSGMGYPYPYTRSPLLLNGHDGTFTDRSREAGLDPPPDGINRAQRIHGKWATRGARCAATGDFDGDGRLDLVVGRFNDTVLLLMNRWPKRGWAEIKLVGKGGNRDAIGALVTLKVRGRTLVRQVQAAGGYLAQSSSVLHFGLGDATSIERCEIRWPDGAVQVVEGLEPNRLTKIVRAVP